jgi:hypothetical protein
VDEELAAPVALRATTAARAVRGLSFLTSFLAPVAGGLESEKRPYPPVNPISSTSKTAAMRAVYFLIFLTTFRNLSNAVNKASPTAAVVQVHPVRLATWPAGELPPRGGNRELT